MKRPLPAELEEVMCTLSTNWELASLQFWSMGWIAVVATKAKKFQLVSDRGYIDAHEFIDGCPVAIPPPEDQRSSITPKQICALLQTRACHSPQPTTGLEPGRG